MPWCRKLNSPASLDAEKLLPWCPG